MKRHAVRMSACVVVAMGLGAGAAHAATVTGVTIEDVSSELISGYQRYASNTVSVTGSTNVEVLVVAGGGGGVRDTAEWAKEKRVRL